MSKNKERAEKICLNCNSELYDRYCHKCGQENIEPKQSVWHLITHFFYDITHFDGKFFSTLKYLIKKPGFLSAEYMNGRRQSYLNPIRMYVFSSALFFLVFFSLFSVKNSTVNNGFFIDEGTVDDLRSQAYKGAVTKEDSTRIDSGLALIQQATFPKKDTSKNKDSGDNKIRTKLENRKGLNISAWLVEEKMTAAEYDSIQRSLPEGEKDSWLEHQFKHREISINERYRDNPGQFWPDVLNKFIHTFPYLLFISLPLYALYLKLLYIRRKQFFYVDHGIFLVHLYIFTFIFMLFYFLLEKLKDNFQLGWMSWAQGILILFGIYYTYRSMRNFYKQGFFKTFIKFCLLNLLAFITLMFLFALFFVLSVFQL
ncbi:MAG TPA: DUF3667 domain-containing protein [Chitinophagaceae bacterium]|nr:DUF3667 domain-containing protein [Chitinophagaceae bacterium]